MSITEGNDSHFAWIYSFNPAAPKALSHLCLATDGLFLVQASVFVENPWLQATVSYPGDSILQSALFAPALRVSMPSRTQSSLSLVKDGGGILFRAKHLSHHLFATSDTAIRLCFCLISLLPGAMGARFSGLCTTVFFLRQELSVAWSSQTRVGWLSSGPHLFPPAYQWGYRYMLQCLAFVWVLGIYQLDLESM